MSSFLSLFESKKINTENNYKPELKKNESKKNLVPAKSSSQTSVVNGIYRTVKPSRSRIYQDNTDVTEKLRSYKSNDNKMFVSPTASKKSNSVDKVDDSNDLIHINSVDDIIAANNASSDVVYYRRFSSSEDELELKHMEGSNPYTFFDDLDDDGENDEGVLIDVLPSFQFYDSLVKFLPEDKLDDDDVPALINNESSFPFFESANSQLDFNPPEYYSSAIPSPLNVQEGILQAQGPRSRTNAAAFRYEVDKFYKLPHKVSKNLEIRIILTKNPVEPNTLSEKENLLREFSSGELINGYVTIINKSKDPIKFEGFYVSFEGVINLNERKEKMVTTMRFLKTHDLSASWSYAQVELASGVNYDATILDETDNSRLGLPNSKILKPHMKYKKYFCFKVPNEILDSNCKHQLPQHLSLPPTFGLDRGSTENTFIEMNSVLGYGHTGLKGSAILCPDLASYDDYVASYLKRNMKGTKIYSKLKQGFGNEGSNISYSVSCKLIMKNETNNLPYILNDTVYNIRIIPSTLSTNRKYRYTDGKTSLVNVQKMKKKLYLLNDKAISKMDQLNTLLQKLEHWDDETTFSKDDLTSQLSEILEKKQVPAKLDSKTSWDQLLLNRSSLNNSVLLEKNFHHKSDVDSESVNYFKDTYRTTLNVYGDVKKSSINSLDKINTLFGTTGYGSSNNNVSVQTNKIILEAKLNKDLKALPYHRSKYISIHNKISQKNKTDRKVWMSEVIPQLPVDPNDYVLTILPISLIIENKHADFPKLKKLTAKLHSYTAYSQRSCPILFDSNCIQEQGKLISQMVFNSKESVKNIKNLKKRYFNYEKKLNRLVKKLNVDERLVKFETFIDSAFFSDLEALASLNIEEFEISNVFKPTVIPPDSMLKWEPVGASQLKCEFGVNLHYLDDLMLTILPSFDTCLISRFYHLEIECMFNNGEKSVLKIPVDVKHFK
ncbi:hypothetical protein QEN19_000591 [Hanseniaspora menglaensis]